ncbi:ABC transporter ATP-binding protein [Spirochaetia bacterium]|nr:ABC transporter ATP-binding protein [Spirochaetia bacterium]
MIIVQNIEMSEIAIRVEHLSKKYHLGVINNGTLFRDIQTWFALKLGKEDPHSKIGENKYSINEDHFWALKDISFDIKQGDRIGIIGKNGAGKSTLLKLLSHITAPTEGTIKINGKIASLLEVGTGFHSELTGRENIYLNGAILGMKKRRIDQKLDEIIDFSGIKDHIDTPVKRYSSGMYVRLAFAVAAHLDSDILIADEVLAVGDAEFQKKALGKMQDLSTGQGRTVLFVSHNMGAVKNLCDAGFVLERGKIAYASGNIQDVINFYLHIDDISKNSSWTNVNKLCADNLYYMPFEFFIGDNNGNIIEKTINSDNEDVYIHIVCEIKILDPALMIGYSIYNEEGTLLYYSGSNDIFNKNTPALVKGKNHLFSQIPIHIFNSGSFIIEMTVHLFNIAWILAPRDNVPSLKLNIKKFTEGYCGIFRPKIQWQTKTV